MFEINQFAWVIVVVAISLVVAALMNFSARRWLLFTVLALVVGVLVFPPLARHLAGVPAWERSSPATPRVQPASPTPPNNGVDNWAGGGTSPIQAEFDADQFVALGSGEPAEPRQLARDDQPNWVALGSRVDERQQIELLVVQSDPMLTQIEAERNLGDKMESAVAQMVDRWIEPGAGRILAFDEPFIRANLLDETASETVDLDLGQFKIAYAQLAMDQAFASHASELWKQHETHSRLLQAGLVGGSVLLILVLALGYFRADHATRGFYTGRLQILTLTLILGLIAVAVWLGRSFMWL